MTEKEKEQDKQIDSAKTKNIQVVDESLVAPLSGKPLKVEHAFVSKGPHTHDADGKRIKTKGEMIFDWFNYAGFGWIGNEIVSGQIADHMIHEGGRLNGLYKPVVNKLHDVFKVAQKNAKGEASWINVAATMFVMTIGGHTMVAPIRYFEDRKAKMVRGIDVMLDGHKSLDDPKTKALHEAMDKEPQQSWGSLWQGRLVTVVSAIAMHFAIGEKNAWSTKLSKGTFMEGWSSLERINTSFFRVVAKKCEAWFGFDKGVTERIEAAKKFEVFENGQMQRPFQFDILSTNTVKRGQAPEGLLSEGKIASAGKKYGLVFMVSGVLAAAFYITSKLFANERDKKKMHAEEHRTTHTSHTGLDSEPSINTDEQRADTPKMHVSNIALNERIHAAEQGVSVNG